MSIRDPAGIRRATSKVGNFGGLPGRRLGMLIAGLSGKQHFREAWLRLKQTDLIPGKEQFR